MIHVEAQYLLNMGIPSVNVELRTRVMPYFYYCCISILYKGTGYLIKDVNHTSNLYDKSNIYF